MNRKTGNMVRILCIYCKKIIWKNLKIEINTEREKFLEKLQSKKRKRGKEKRIYQ